MSKTIGLSPTDKINVLFIHHAAGWGGAPRSMLNVIKALNPARYNVHVLLLRDSVVREILAKEDIECSVVRAKYYKKNYNYFIHSEVTYLEWYQMFRWLKTVSSWLFSRYWYAQTELDHFECDIIHLNSSALTDWLKPAYLKAKVVLHVREPIKNRSNDIVYKFMARQIRLYSDMVIAISEDNAKRIGCHWKTHTIHNFAEIAYTSLDKESYISKKVLYLGGAAESKGFVNIVKALPLLNSDIQVLFVGYYSAATSSMSQIKTALRYLKPKNRLLRDSLREMELNHRSKVIGLVTDVEKLIDECCCLVSPFSIPHFSRPIMEAHLRRKPVIATRVQGICEQVRDGIDGILVERDDYKGLAAAINDICDNPDKCQQMGEQGYNEAARKYGPENVRKIEEIYEQLMADSC